MTRYKIHATDDETSFGAGGVVCRQKFWGVRRDRHDRFEPPTCKGCLRRIGIRIVPDPVPQRPPEQISFAL